jgi:hypothetical protein
MHNDFVSIQLKNILLQEINSSADISANIDMVGWLTKTTLDILGLAAFGYEFDALTSAPGSQNELNAALSGVFQPMQKLAAWSLFTAMFPVSSYRSAERPRRYHPS